jgi:hypothetical protein
MSTAFAWTILPFDENSCRISGTNRLVLGSSLGTLVFIALFFRSINNEPFYEDISSQLSFILSLYQPANADATQNIAAIFELIKNVILRGGALFSAIILLLTETKPTFLFCSMLIVSIAFDALKFMQR